MNADLKQKWIAALRSGEYERGVTNFERNGRYCPLGVLCVVAGQPLRTGVWDNFSFVNRALRDSGVNAPAVWIANDLQGWSFEQTASWLEDALQVTESTE